MSVKYTAQDVITEASKWIGYCEKASNSSLGNGTNNLTTNAGNGNYTWFGYYIYNKYPSFYNGNKNGYAWCDQFVDFCNIKAAEAAGGSASDAMTALYQPEKSAGAGCYYSAQYYKQKKAFYSTPKAGDQIFLYVSGKINHTGLVYAVDGGYVYTIEGNSNNKVQKLRYKLTDGTIAGYGRPAYGVETKTQTSETKAEKANSVAAGVQEYKNGSTIEPVYQTSACKDSEQIGCLNADEQCYCFGYAGGAYLACYKVDGTENTWKCGYVKYSGKTTF